MGWGVKDNSTFTWQINSKFLSVFRYTTYVDFLGSQLALISHSDRFFFGCITIMCRYIATIPKIRKCKCLSNLNNKSPHSTIVELLFFAEP